MRSPMQKFLQIGVVALVSNAAFTPAMAEESTVDPSQMPYYDKTNDRAKLDIKNYLAAKPPKALAIHTGGGTYWWGPEPQQAEASRRALENCELSYKSPCVLAALDNVIQKHDPTAIPASAFANLGRDLDPDKVPFLGDAARKRLSARYLQARKNTLQYLAVALHPRNGWYIKVDPSFASQADANSAALSACVNVAPPNRWWNRGSCLLFSEGSKIVANLPQAVTFASAAMVKAAEDGQVNLVKAPDQVPPTAVSLATSNAVLDARAGAPANVHLIWMGDNDCPPCIAWRGAELPKLQKTEVYKSITFSYVTKAIASPFPSRVFLPETVKPLYEKLAHANNGLRGSPQWAFIVNGQVYDYKTGAPPSAEEVEKMLLAARDGTAYPVERCLVRDSDSWRKCMVKG